MKHSTNNPEFMAIAGLLERREKLYDLIRDLSRQEKITQGFLKRFMTEMLDAWFELEEKTEMALNASGKHRELAMQAMIKADNAIRATDVVIEIGKAINPAASFRDAQSVATSNDPMPPL